MNHLNAIEFAPGVTGYDEFIAAMAVIEGKGGDAP